MKKHILLIALILTLTASAVPSLRPTGMNAAADVTRVASVPSMLRAPSVMFHAQRQVLGEDALLPSGTPLVSQASSNGDGLLHQSGIRFQENRGQFIDTDGNIRSDIAFVADAPGARLYLRSDGISYVFTKEDSDSGIPPSGRDDNTVTYRMDMKLVGCNPNARVRGADELPGFVNYYRPHCPDGITGVREYGRIVYENVYDNVDLELSSAGGRMKYNLVVRPGGRASDIRMKYDGATATALTRNGALSVVTPIGRIEEAVPYTYAGSADSEVASHFVREGNTVSFAVADYDPARTLVIDPWATYFGGTNGVGAGWASGITSDAAGNVFVAGIATTGYIPVTNGVAQTQYGGNWDAFVAKFDIHGNRIWATYYGGGGTDSYTRVALDAAGNVLLSGSTSSADFPVSPGAFQSAVAGGRDAFLVKLDGSANRIWATFLGGSNGDIGMDLAVDAGDNVIITGSTASKDFPVSANAFQTTRGGHLKNTPDAFVTKFNAGGALLWSTYCGGSSWDDPYGIAAFGHDVVITGLTDGNFPVSAGAFQTTFAGEWDAFLVRFDNAGGRVWGTYYGGSARDEGDGVAFDASGNIVLAGQTGSVNLPVTAGGFQMTNAGGGDGFVTLFHGSGFPQWGTYFGGGANDSMSDIAVDAEGNIVFAGCTGSGDLPVSAGAFQSWLAGPGDGYAAKFSITGARLWSTYYGGSDNDRIEAVDADVFGNVLLAGRTASANFPVLNAYQPVMTPPSAVIVQLNSSGLLPGHNFPPFAVAQAAPSQGTAPLTVGFHSDASHDPDGVISAYAWSFGDGGTSALANPTHTYSTAGNYTAQLTITDNDNATATASVHVTVMAQGGYVYVYDQAVTRVNVSGSKWKGRDLISIRDHADQPVPGALVTATYSGPNSGTVSGTTGAGGEVTLETSAKNNPAGIWCFTVTNVQLSGWTFNTSTGVLTACEGVPKTAQIVPGAVELSVYPNPFTLTTTIALSIPAETPVYLSVYDALGRERTVLADDILFSGNHRVGWSPGNTVPSGMYMLRLIIRDRTGKQSVLHQRVLLSR